MVNTKKGIQFALLAVLLSLPLASATYLWQGAKDAEKGQKSAAVIRGTVRSTEGTALAGILVRARGEGKNYTTTVGTDENGRYEFPPLPLRSYEVSVGTAWRERVELGASGAIQDFAVQLGFGLMNQTTGASWVEAIPGTAADKLLLRRCGTNCHSVWRFIDRPQSTLAGWTAVMKWMAAIGPTGTPLRPGQPYLLELNQQEIEALTEFLAKAVTPQMIEKYAAEAIVRGEASKAVFTEWDLPHKEDTATGTWTDAQGIIWYTTSETNAIGRLDPRTGEFQQWPYAVPNAVLHDMMADAQGNLWVTAAGANRIIKFDTKTFRYTDWAIPEKYGRWVHTGDFDPDGNYWATLERDIDGVGAVIKLDPRTGTITGYPVPTPKPDNYGLVIDQKGDVWFTEWLGHKVAKIDRRTGKVTEYSPPTPNAGPRRIQVDSKGRLWFTEFFVSKIGMLDPITGKITEYDIGVPAGYPYFIKIDKYDKIWFDLLNGNLLGKFDPETKKFARYLLPTPESFGRDAAFDYSTEPHAIVFGAAMKPILIRMYVRGN